VSERNLPLRISTNDNACAGSTGCFFNEEGKESTGFKVFCNSQENGIPTLWNCMLDDSPLRSNSTSNRAWCFQETFLSPRSIYFQRSQVYWECRTFQANETFPQGLNHSERPSRGKVTELNFSPRAFLQGWLDVVASYSSGELTNWSDRLIALSGIAKLFYYKSRVYDSEIPGTSHRPQAYLAGMWREELEIYLLWHLEQPSPKLHPRSFPSWSWASSQGYVLWQDIGLTEMRSNVRVLNASTVLATDDPFGSVSAGVLQLECNPPVPINLILSQKENVVANYLISVNTTILRTEIFLDSEPPYDDNTIDNVFALHVQLGRSRLNKYFHEGLLLQKFLDSNDYRRVGFYRLPVKNSDGDPFVTDIQDCADFGDNTPTAGLIPVERLVPRHIITII
jgi:hypothetical protein